MNLTENINNINHITLNGYEWTTSYWICNTLNISYDRLKKWREGRGVAAYINLSYIDLGRGFYLYRISDIDLIWEEHRKEND